MVGRNLARQWLPITLAALSVFVAPAQSVFADPPAFANGEWNGSMTGSGTVQFDKDGITTDFTSTWDGAFNFKVNSGQVTTGDWSMIGEGISHVDTGGDSTAGRADFRWEGNVEGDAVSPALEGVATMHMRVLGQNIDVTLSRDQTANPKLEIYTADCSHVTGDWTAGISQGIADNEGDSNITGPFAAYNFTDSLVDVDVFNAYMHDLGVFQGHVVAGDFQHGELSSLIIRAEALQRLLRNGPECFVTADWFSILAYSVVRDLVNWAFAHPGQFTTDDLAFITRIAVRSGVLGAGAQDQDYAQQTEDTLKGAFDARLTQAIANGDRGEVLEIMELAVEMHWTDQAARASQWLAGG